MKTSFILAVLLFAVAGACTQKSTEADVPAVVKESFARQFPGAGNVKWSKENDSEFEAEFKGVGGEQSANFDANGKWLITETEIALTDLPAAVQGAVEREFAGYKIEEAEMAETPDQGAFYELKIEQGEKTLVVQVAVDGKIMKSEPESEEGDEEESEEKD